MASLPPYAQNLSLQNIWILGAARSGIAAAKYLKKRGARVFVSELRQIEPSVQEELNSYNIPFEMNGHSENVCLREATLLVISPGIRRDQGLVAKALAQNIPVVSEIEVGFWELFQTPRYVAGITGTNGKSTTTHYLAQLFARYSGEALPCGNYGLPLTTVLEKNPTVRFLALELSSYQLESTSMPCLHASAILNLQPDHLARYGTLENYLRAKWKILDLTRPEGTVLLQNAVFAYAQSLGLTPQHPHVVLVGNKAQTFEKLDSLNYERVLYTYHPQKGSIDIEIYPPHSSQPQEHYNIDKPCLPGAHNAENLIFASLLALKTSPQTQTWSTILEQWDQTTSHYQHLAHRLERIGHAHTCFYDSKGHVKQIAIYNDSKATNLSSLEVALEAFPHASIRLLVGGDPKGESFSPLTNFWQNPVVRFYPFGKAGPEIFEILSKKLPKEALSHEAFPSLFQAALAALDDACDGEILLLSPACASFDEFKDFEHRGNAFRTWCLERSCTKEKSL